MHSGKAVFAQLAEWIHPEHFRRCVTRYRGHYKVQRFSCWDQFLAMAFAQVTLRESLADIEICLRSRRDQLYHLGFRSSVAHSTLADAWIAVCVYVLVAIIRKELRLEASLSQMLQILNVHAFEQVPLAELFAKTTPKDELVAPCNQLMLGD